MIRKGLSERLAILNAVDRIVRDPAFARKSIERVTGMTRDKPTTRRADALAGGSRGRATLPHKRAGKGKT